MERDYLLLWFDAPLQSWGGVAFDPVRPTRPFPTMSAIAGLLASALGWTYRDGERTTGLQDSLDYAVRQLREPQVVVDYQTADLESIGTVGWTRWGLEKRSGSAARGTQILWKHYLADGDFLVAVGVFDGSPVTIDQLQDALLQPARPLFLGRKSCLPARPLLASRVTSATAFNAVVDYQDPESERGRRSARRDTIVWYADGRGPVEGEPELVWDRRDFSRDRFGGERIVRRIRVKDSVLPASRESV